MRFSREPQDNLSKLPPGGGVALVRRSTIWYGIMMLIGLVVLRFGHKNLNTALAIPHEPYELLRLGLIGLLGAGLLLVLSYFFEDWFPSYRNLKSTIMRFLGPVSAPSAVYLALLTAFGEELLFRGAIQPFAGLFVTSILFGLLHLGADGLVSWWSVWALIAGLLLGWMYDETSSLWPPIVAHFGVNTVSILSLRRAYKSWTAHLGEIKSSETTQTK